MRKPSLLSQLMVPLLGVALVAALMAPAWLSQRLDPKKKPALEGVNPVFIEMSLWQSAGRHDYKRGATDVATARWTRGSAASLFLRGQFTLHFTNGTSARMLFRPGHTNVNYEFSWSNGLFAVPRSSFMATLAGAGINTNEIPTK